MGLSSESARPRTSPSSTRHLWSLKVLCSIPSPVPVTVQTRSFVVELASMCLRLRSQPFEFYKSIREQLRISDMCAGPHHC